MSSYSVDVRQDGAATTLTLRGRVTIADAQALWDDLHRGVGSLERGRAARIDLSSVEHADGAAVAVLVETQAELRGRGIPAELTGATGAVAELLRVYRGGAVHFSPPRERSAKETLERIGHGTFDVLQEVQSWLTFLGMIFVALVGAVRRPRTANWKAVPALIERAGSGGAPIVLVINFLIGLITSYEFGVALKRFAATSYVPDFVGLSVTRELAPLMTAIVVAGRTGAAFTAELGSMKVSEEIDALRVLGIDPLRFLVVPRVAALALTLPLLTLMADGMGIIGGLFIATINFEMAGAVYWRETRNVVFASDILFGVGKSAVLALAIAMISCHQGLATSGGATGVGRRTTASVVSILFAIIIIDALFVRRS
jgi:phospholipid/cholesterol/gamma-HCH transport system permease protein